jgi:ferredoxin
MSLNILVFKVKFFKNRVPLFLERILDYNLRPRPEFDEKKCIGCGECYRACPPDAITMKDNFPSVDLMKCIRCYCCQELCPVKAVEIYRPWILRKIVKM